MRDRVDAKAVWAVDRRSGSSLPWRAALDALRRHLPAVKWPFPRVSFVLSSHFCHFALLKNSEGLTGDDEWVAYARHRMKATFGETIADWSLVLSYSGEQGGYLACAADGALLEAIRALCKERHLQLTSIRPYLATAFNRCRSALETRTAWFVVHEEGRFVVSLFKNGEWESIASRRMLRDWKAELFDVLDREQQLLEVEGAGCKDVLLYAPELPHVGDFKGGRYRVEQVRAEALDVLGDGEYAMAA